MTITSISEPDGKKMTCTCGNKEFFFSQGTKKRNLKKYPSGASTWEQKAYFIMRCTKCGKRYEHVKYDWRRVATVKIQTTP